MRFALGLLFYRKEHGVVTFISDHVPSKSEAPLVRPKPTSPNQQRSAPSNADNEYQAILPNRASPSASSDEDNIDFDSTDHHDPEDGYLLDGSGVIWPDANESPDVELKGILDSLGDILDCNMDESEASNFQYIGVAEDAFRTVDFAFPNSKRFLSLNTLVALNREHGYGDSSKRLKLGDLKEYPSIAPTTLCSTFSLGPPAMKLLPQFLNASPIISVDDDAELDRQLGSELDEHDTDKEGEESPVPLLTPPASPLTVEINGTRATVCEWPSNLTVDSAMLAVNDFDPDSLATLEENGQGQGWYRKEDTHRETTKLTPLLRSFCV